MISKKKDLISVSLAQTYLAILHASIVDAQWKLKQL
jgi:hypothetical protein